MFDLIIRGDRVVTPHGVGEYDVAVQGERIVAVAAPGTLPMEAKRVIDAHGKIVVPGGVEPHAHVKMRIPQKMDLFSQQASGASRTCAFGGTTTVVDFAVSGPETDPLAAVQEKISEFEGDSYIDFSFHCVVAGEVPVEHMEQIPEVIRQGVPSIKCFTIGKRTHPKSTPQVPDGHLHEVMSIVARSGGIVAIHAENQFMLEFNREKLKREGRIGVENMHLVHTGLSEDTEFRKVIRLGEQAGAALYMLHVSAKEGVAAIAEARSKGLPIYGETLHNYTGFNSEVYKEPDGAKYHTYPSLKYPEDQAALWSGLIDGPLSIMATDDVTTSYELKTRWNTIFDCRGGHVGMETRIPYTFSEGVAKGRISLERFVEITSSNPARILGMYPRKGAIAAGSDADFAIIDPNLKRKVKASELHADCDYSIWEGWEFQGWPVATILRGKVIVENGKLLGSLQDGRFLARKMAPEVLAGPAF